MRLIFLLPVKGVYISNFTIDKKVCKYRIYSRMSCSGKKLKFSAIKQFTTTFKCPIKNLGN